MAERGEELRKLPRHVEFGWGAPPLAEQFPALNINDALRFDGLNLALVRLHVGGVLSDSEFQRAIVRLRTKIEIALRAALLSHEENANAA